jgi:transposase
MPWYRTIIALWTLARVGQLIAREFGPQYSTVHVMRLLRELGFSCQKPEKRATQRDEQSIAEWRTQRWPALKKSPPARPCDCLHR